MGQLNVPIPDDLHNLIRAGAVNAKKKIPEFVEGILREKLEVKQ